MATELKTDGWRRYMLYRRDEHYMTFESEQKRREVAEAGKKFVAMAYADVWARDAELVKRVRAFLGKNFHWHDRLVKSGTDLDVVQTLREMVRGDSVVVIPEDAMKGGSVPASGLLPATKRAYSVMDPETAAEMRAIARSILYPPGEVVLSGPYRPDREASGQLAAARAAMIDSSGGTSTLLGGVSPFEYQINSAGGDVESIAARGVSAAEEAECDALYDADMMACGFAGAMYRDPRSYMLCKQRAFENYQLCRGYQ
jgi:hypothetical protein